jgi:hypothetical protein
MRLFSMSRRAWCEVKDNNRHVAKVIEAER